MKLSQVSQQPQETSHNTCVPQLDQLINENSEQSDFDVDDAFLDILIPEVILVSNLFGIYIERHSLIGFNSIGTK